MAKWLAGETSGRCPVQGALALANKSGVQAIQHQEERHRRQHHRVMSATREAAMDAASRHVAPVQQPEADAVRLQPRAGHEGPAGRACARHRGGRSTDSRPAGPGAGRAAADQPMAGASSAQPTAAADRAGRRDVLLPSTAAHRRQGSLQLVKLVCRNGHAWTVPPCLGHASRSWRYAGVFPAQFRSGRATWPRPSEPSWAELQSLQGSGVLQSSHGSSSAPARASSALESALLPAYTADHPGGGGSGVSHLSQLTIRASRQDIRPCSPAGTAWQSVAVPTENRGPMLSLAP